MIAKLVIVAVLVISCEAATIVANLSPTARAGMTAVGEDFVVLLLTRKKSSVRSTAVGTFLSRRRKGNQL